MEKSKRGLLVIQDPSDLLTLSVLPLKRPMGMRRVMIGEGLVPEVSRQELDEQINKHLFACGCTESAIGIVVAVIGYAAWALLASPDLSWVALTLYGVGAVFGGAVVGRIYGLLRAEKRLRQTVENIRDTIKSAGMFQPRPNPGEPICG